jgi:hypothetical protein
MEYLLVDKDQWIAVDPGIAPIGTSADDWKKLDQKQRAQSDYVSRIQYY